MSPETTFRASTTRLTLTYGTIVLLLVIVLQGAVYLLTRNALEREVERVVTGELDEMTRRYSSGGQGELVHMLQSRTDSWGRTGAVYMLTDASMQPLAGNLTAWPRDITPVHDADARFRIAAAGEQSSHPVRGHILRVPGGGWLLVGTDTSEMEKSLRRFGWATVWGIAAISALIVLLGRWYAERAARRVRAFSQTCDLIVHSDLSRRLTIGRQGDEYDQLGRTVNDMLGRLEQQAVLLRTTFGSIAHDLRTPLYRLRVRLEEALLRPDVPAASRELVQPALDELDRVQRTLGTLLEIARAEGGGTLAGNERVDLAQLAREMFELYQPGMQDAGLELSINVKAAAVIAGKRQLLAQLIANLLENAMKYVPEGGKVALAVGADAKRLTLTVSDNGPGIPAADIERAQEPFVTLQQGNPDKVAGSGLGLSLVKAIVRLHRGELRLADNGPGLLVECRFERAAG
jgi:signal transduction histidine kinase